MKLIKSPPNNPLGLKPGDCVVYGRRGRTARVVELLDRQSRAVVEFDDWPVRLEVDVLLLKSPPKPSEEAPCEP